MSDSKFRMGLATAALLLSVQGAYSADMIAEPQSAGYQWSGFYIGGGIGAGAVNHEFPFPGGSFDGLGG